MKTKLLGATALIVALLACNVANSATYHLTMLQGFNGPASIAYGLNDVGVVVGTTFAPNGYPAYATIWRDGRPIALPSPAFSAVTTLTGAGGAGINNAGVVAGTTFGCACLSDGGEATTVWKDGMLAALANVSGTIDSSAYGINDRDQVVGFTLLNEPNGFNATVWSNGQPTLLANVPGATFANSVAINNAGDVVGVTGTGSYFQATIWKNGGAPTVLVNPVPGSAFAQALAINNARVVAGFVNPTNTTAQAVMWDASGTPTLLPNLPGISDDEVSGINDAGDAVGGSFQNSGSVATLWRRGTVIDLNTVLDSDSSGFVLQYANAINDRGQIVGYGVNSLGQQEGFLLTPVYGRQNERAILARSDRPDTMPR